MGRSLDHACSEREACLSRQRAAKIITRRGIGTPMFFCAPFMGVNYHSLLGFAREGGPSSSSGGRSAARDEQQASGSRCPASAPSGWMVAGITAVGARKVLTPGDQSHATQHEQCESERHYPRHDAMRLASPGNWNSVRCARNFVSSTTREQANDGTPTPPLVGLLRERVAQASALRAPAMGVEAGSSVGWPARRMSAS